jgi:hypothetical protein
VSQKLNAGQGVLNGVEYEGGGRHDQNKTAGQGATVSAPKLKDGMHWLLLDVEKVGCLTDRGLACRSPGCKTTDAYLACTAGGLHCLKSLLQVQQEVQDRMCDNCSFTVQPATLRPAVT